MSQPSLETQMQLAPEVEARIRAWMQSDMPMEIAGYGEHEACLEVLRRLGEQPETTAAEKIAIQNLKHLTEEFTARQVHYTLPVTPEVATRLQARFEERKRIRCERIAAAPQAAPRSGIYTDGRGRRHLYARPEPGVRYACPCCQLLTLPERNGYDICPVCFWEDDGQDDHDADVKRGGSNHGISLTQGRQNYLTCGASSKRLLPYVRAPLDRERP